MHTAQVYCKTSAKHNARTPCKPMPLQQTTPLIHPPKTPLIYQNFIAQTVSVFLPKEQPGLMQIDLLIAHLWAHIVMDTINFALIGFYVASLIDDRKIRHLQVYNPFLFFGVQFKFNIKETSSLLFCPISRASPLGGRLLSFT